MRKYFYSFLIAFLYSYTPLQSDVSGVEEVLSAKRKFYSNYYSPPRATYNRYYYYKPYAQYNRGYQYYQTYPRYQYYFNDPNWFYYERAPGVYYYFRN